MIPEAPYMEENDCAFQFVKRNNDRLDELTHDAPFDIWGYSTMLDSDLL